MVSIKDRIVELRRVKASELMANPLNWRTHGDEQRSRMTGLLEEIGYANALVAREDENGKLELIDGHLRAEITPGQKVPVLIVDLTAEEARLALATFDSVGAMAGTDSQSLVELLSQVEASHEDVEALLADLREATGVMETDAAGVVLQKVDTSPPPKMSWALIGIPTVRFGEIQSALEGIAQIDGVTIATGANDG